MGSKEMICSIAETKNERIADINHAVWSYAEGGYQEHKSAAKLIEVLRSEDSRWRRGPGASRRLSSEAMGAEAQ